jgi:N-acylneuraminate cytidylyltransferase
MSISSGPVVALIPARAGSKGIPDKNLREVGGVPLIVRAIRSAQRASRIDRVVVSTDGERIAAAARAAGAEVIDRPAELAADSSSSESAILHALDALHLTDGVVVFIQATSPFIAPADLDSAVGRVAEGDEDVVFSAVEVHEFLWSVSETRVDAINHDASFRPRRQDRAPQYRETGAFYVMSTAGFRHAGFRFFGRIGLATVDERGSLEIDTLAELELAGVLATDLDPVDEVRADCVSTDLRDPFDAGPDIDVDAVVTDFDGVHTDDRVQLRQDGTESVSVNRRDGLGARLLREAGIPVLILSTEANPVVTARAAKLGVEVLQGIDDKASALTGWAAARGIPLERIAYLGNEVNDLGALRSVGWPIAVSDAHPAAIDAARHVLTTRGGAGAVRELAEMVLKGKGER